MSNVGSSIWEDCHDNFVIPLSEIFVRVLHGIATVSVVLRKVFIGSRPQIRLTFPIRANRVQ